MGKSTDFRSAGMIGFNRLCLSKHKRATRSSLCRRVCFTLATCIATVGFGGARVAAGPTQAPPSAPQATESTLPQARRLMEQGKFDEAISQLQQLSASKPGL